MHSNYDDQFILIKYRPVSQIVSLTELMAGVKAPTKTVQLFQLTCFPLGHKVKSHVVVHHSNYQQPVVLMWRTFHISPQNNETTLLFAICVISTSVFQVPTSTNSLVALMNMVENWRAKTDYGPVCVVSP